MKIAFVCAEDINLGVGYVITFLKSQGHDVKLFFDPKQGDRGYLQNKLLANFLDISSCLIFDIQRFNPDICCFSCVTATYQWALKIAKQIKEKVGCKIIFGGVHPTLVPERVKKRSFIDDVVVGDGLEYFGGKFDPDKIFPDREIFLKELPPEHRKTQLFMTSFGCPFNCTYCGNEQLRKVGQHKLFRRDDEACIRELEQIKKIGAKYILFVDDIFTMNKDWLKKFLPKYKSRIDLPFSCFVHPSCVDKESVDLIKMAGCECAWMGIQTGCEPLRKDILNRKETNQQIIESSKIIKDAGIKLIVDHIFGIPFESELSNDLSEYLYKEIKPDIVNCYHMLYFPKSEIINHALRSGYLKQEDVENIEEGKGFVYQQNNMAQKYFDIYAKGFIAIPLGGIMFEFLPTTIIKLLIFIRAKRLFTIRAIIENEIFFTWKAIKRKWNGRKKSTK